MWRVKEEGERDASYNNSSLFIFLIKKKKSETNRKHVDCLLLFVMND